MLRTLVTLALVASPSVVLAQTAPSLGEQHYQAGVDAYARGEYHAAAIEFRAAFELTGEPQLQFNLGNALAADGQRDAACQAIRAYVTALPNAPNRAAADARVRELCATTNPATPPVIDRAPPPPTVVTPPPVVTPPRARESLTARSPWPTVGLVAGATGLAATVVGLGLWADVASQHDACVTQGWCSEDAKPRGENVAAAALIYGGAALSVAGLVTWLVAPRTRRAHSPTAWLVAQPGLLGVGGAF